MSRQDPLGGFRFVVEIAGIEVGGFQKVSGIERETTVEEYREGGVNDFTYKLATLTKYPNLKLTRGLILDDGLWGWHQDTIDGFPNPQDVTIVLRDFEGLDQWRWECHQAYPVKWSGSDLDAGQGAVMVETVELAHQGVRRVG